MPASLINYSVTVTGRQQDRPEFARRRPRTAGRTTSSRERREVFLPAERVREQVPISTTRASRSARSVDGPAIVDAVDTTIYVPRGTTAERDEYLNYVLTR